MCAKKLLNLTRVKRGVQPLSPQPPSFESSSFHFVADAVTVVTVFASTGKYFHVAGKDNFTDNGRLDMLCWHFTLEDVWYLRRCWCVLRDDIEDRAGNHCIRSKCGSQKMLFLLASQVIMQRNKRNEGVNHRNYCM